MFSRKWMGNQNFNPLREEKRQRVAINVWQRDLQSCWECPWDCYTPIQCQTTAIVAPTWWHTTTWWPDVFQKVDGKPKFQPTEGRKTPTCGHKCMAEGLTIMLGVSMGLLYTYTMPNNCYCSTYMMAYHHLMARGFPKVDGKPKFQPTEGRKTPTCGCKSMVEGLTIMLIVFINLLYTHTMPNNHYCSTYMMAYPHLMAKHCLKAGRKSRFLPELRHETCPHVAINVWWKDLQSCW